MSQTKRAYDKFLLYALLIIALGVVGFISATTILDPNYLTTTGPVDASEYRLSSVNKTDIFAYPQQPASYIVWENGGTYYAKSGETGVIDFSGPLFSTVYQAAIDAVETAGGGAVLLRPGNFVVRASVVPKDNVNLFGSGRFQSILVGHSDLVNTAIIQLIGGSTSNYLENVTISDIGFQGKDMHKVGYHVDRKAIYIKYVLNGNFLNLWINGTSATGLGPDYLVNCVIDNVLAENCGTTGQTGGSNGIGIAVNNDNETSIISNCIARGNANYGIIYEGSSTDGDGNYLISNCISYNNRIGIGAAGASKVTIDSCSSFDNSVDGVTSTNFNLLASDYFTVTSNKVFNNTQHGVHIYATAAEYSIISDNMLWGNTGDNVYVRGDYITIQNNIMIGERIVIKADCSNVLVQGNILHGTTIVDEPADTTIKNNKGHVTENIGAATILSGTTNITITHGLAYTPTSANTEWTVSYLENPTNDPGSWYITGFNATNAIIHVFRDPGASHLDIAWSARRTP